MNAPGCEYHSLRVEQLGEAHLLAKRVCLLFTPSVSSALNFRPA
jgi:hypothetical protein